MISVIIPVYNVMEFLDTCVESIVSQTYQELEIILVNDGSTDESGKMCDIWQTRDKRIRVIHKKNGGLSDARNHGMNIATGDYISFIDSDDFVSPDYFEYLHKLMTVHNADLSVCQLSIVDEKGNVSGRGGKNVDKVVRGRKSCMEAFLMDTAIDTTAWKKLYKTSLFKENGIQYPVGRYHEDVFTTYKVVARCNVIAVGSAPLYAYRKRSGSIVNSSFSPRHFDAIYGNVERFEFIRNLFPDLTNEASKGVIHAANGCVIRMGRAKSFQSEHTDILKEVYKKYLLLYLKSSARFLPKLFAIAARINLRGVLRIVSKCKFD